MLKLLRTLLVLCLSLAGAGATHQPAKRPKLVLLLVIDQFRYDYLTRFRAGYTGGIDRLLKNGAVFTNAHLEHFPTVTAIGHSTVFSGATPSVSGIVGNEWYDRNSGAKVTSVSDSEVSLLGVEKKAGSSPHRLLVSTVGDELKMASKGAPRVIGISFKDRSAILPTGHMADGAYWFDNSRGSFISSNFYFSELPGWVKEFNASRASDRYAAAQWKPLTTDSDGKPFKTLPAAVGPEYYASMLRSPFGNELLESFAERAIEAEKLGGRDTTDLLAISFSSNDYVGHGLGPDAPEVRDISIRTDRLLENLFRFLDNRIGLENVLVVMTADHGVAPLPELLAERKMPGGRMAEQELHNAVEAALAAKYGEGRWILYSAYGTFYLNRDLIHAKNLRQAEVHRVAAQALSNTPHIFRVYTREQLVEGRFLRDPISRRVANGFHLQRSGDVIALLEPYWSFAKHGTTHGSPFSYDSHLPVIFMGPGVKPGRYDHPIAVNDIAPTLATLLDIETPSGSVGRVLTEVLTGR